MAKDKKTEKPRRTVKAKRRRKKIISVVLLLLLGVIIVSSLYYAARLPDIESYEYRKPTSSTVISADGVTIGTIESRTITYIGREEIPDRLVNAVVAIEDKRFFKHGGVDIISIMRAFYHNLKAGEIVEGGSSITQQLAKLLFFSNEQTYSRKIEEALTAIRMEHKYSKDEIITMYLNEIYLGGGAFGVYEASMLYFGIEPLDLTNAQCAMLAGIITAPSAYCPLTEEGYGYATERKEKVLEAMFEQEYLSQEEYDEAMAEEIVITGTERSANRYDYGECLPGCRSFMNRVYEQAVETLKSHYVKQLGYTEAQGEAVAESLLFSQPLTINTTLNYSMQQQALKAVNENVLSRGGGAACAYVSVDSTNGNVLCYYGGDDASYIDMANSPRQPGSTIKPLYMAYLLESGKAAVDSVVNDGPFSIDGYAPRNHSGSYHGWVTMRETLVNSLNCASLKFFTMANTRDEVDFVASLGISTLTENDYTYAFALGGLYEGIKPLEMAEAYGVFANGGTANEANFVVSVQDESGTVVFHEKKEAKKVLSETSAATMRSYLTSVVLRGTAQGANLGYSTMGKTGTTDDSRDVWFAGGTGTTVTVIWVGNIDYNAVENLSSSWCTATYRAGVGSAINNGVFVSGNVAETYGESTQSIYIIKPNSSAALSGEIDPSLIISLTVVDSEIPLYDSVRVEAVNVDITTGLLFSEKCPEENRAVKYYRMGDAPSEYCNSRHNKHDVFDELENWWEELKNKGKSEQNRT